MNRFSDFSNARGKATIVQGCFCIAYRKLLLLVILLSCVQKQKGGAEGRGEEDKENCSQLKTKAHSGFHAIGVCRAKVRAYSDVTESLNTVLQVVHHLVHRDMPSY